mgnify:CR=1 FL=1
MQLHERDMYRTASAILSQDADIADAMQETILTCWEKIDTLQKNRYFKTWMIRILINKCKDILRLGRRMVCVEELPEQETGSTVEAEANLEWKEALQGLDEKYRLIVVLFYAEGLRTAEIGKLLQLFCLSHMPRPFFLISIRLITIRRKSLRKCPGDK